MSSFQAKFDALVKKTTSEQTEHFLKSFVFALGDNWKDVITLQDTFQAYLNEKAEKHDLNAVQAAEFLQKEGRTRTAMQRRAELKDIDLDKNDRICFTEYLMLHYKIMILKEYFERKEMKPTVSLEDDGVGLVDVGELLLEELFTMPTGMSDELRMAIEEFMKKKQERADLVEKLEAKMLLGGVKGLTAKNELMQLDMADKTETNRIEITLAAAKRRAAKQPSGDAELARLKKEEEAAAENKRQASRKKLLERAAMFDRQ